MSSQPAGPSNSLVRIRRSVLAKLYGKRYPARTVGLEPIIGELYTIMADTLTLDRGDSCILVGPRGSGATMAITKSIDKLRKAYPDQFIIIRLNGLSHPDDKMAWRELARQLDKNIPGDNPIEKLSMSATLQGVSWVFEKAALAKEEGSEGAEATDARTVSVIFVVEDLDKYAVAGRQSLLYSLFGWSQDSPIGVTVIGTTTQQNIDQLLEKRVRSRFSQRQIPILRPPTLEDYFEVAQVMLEADDPDLLSEFPSDCRLWNEQISSGLVPGGVFHEIVASNYYTSKNPKVLASMLAPVLCGHTSLTLNRISTTETLMQDMPELDYAILLCAARAQARYESSSHDGSVNLVLVTDEYRALTKELQAERSAGFNFGGYRAWSPRAVRHAWERLQHIELVVPVTMSTTVGQDELKMYHLETSLQDLRGFIPKDHTLYPWTQL